jgi:DNA-binding transcriptional MerR regulator
MPDAGYLTIGKVVAKLQPQYPELSVSKVRYLEDEGLLNPSRTPGGYRLYSQHDVNQLETILYLQKNRFMPLQVIKEQLKKGDVTLQSLLAEEQAKSARKSQASDSGEPGLEPLPVDLDSQEITGKFHPINRMPELLGVSVSFVRQLSEAGVINTRTSPHGRLLVDGRDLQLIRTCEELRRYGIGPKNLRQYVLAANRESGMFEQALVVYSNKKTGGVDSEVTDADREKFSNALTRMLSLTNAVRDSLIRRRINDSFKGMED